MHLVGFITIRLPSLVVVMCCVVSGLYEEPITRSEVSYRARACVLV